MMERTKLNEQIRTELGDPLESELTQTAVELAIDNALVQYSRFKPKERVVAITLQAGVDEYPLEGDVLRVRELITEPSTRGSEMDAFSALSLLSNPSLITVRAMGYDSWNRMEELDWVFEDGKIRVSPVPEQSSPALARIVLLRSYADVTDQDYTAVKQYAIGECMCIMGRRRNKKITEVPTSSGTIRFDDGAELRKEGEKLKKDAFGGMNGTMVSIG